MFQEKNEKKSHKIKNIVFFQLLSKIHTLKNIFILLYCISDTKSSVFRHFLTTYSANN